MRCVPGTPTHHPTTTPAQGKAPVVVGNMRAWRNRQTRRPQKAVPERGCGFNPRGAHQHKRTP